MGQVTLHVNGKPYVLGCEDGRESHLRALAARVDDKVRQIAPEAGSPGELRLLLMAALMIADDLQAAEAARQAADAKAIVHRKDLERIESRVAVALDAVSDRLEKMAPESGVDQLLLL